jgi:hypothetical protein
MTSTTPHTPQPCPPWCTTDHTDDDHGILGHRAKAGEEYVHNGNRLAVHIGAYLHDSPWRGTVISLAYSVADGSGDDGAASLPPSEAPAVAGLLRALGHADIADALDRAVATLGGAS